jgi:hypothetical protein
MNIRDKYLNEAKSPSPTDEKKLEKSLYKAMYRHMVKEQGDEIETLWELIDQDYTYANEDADEKVALKVYNKVKKDLATFLKQRM